MKNLLLAFVLACASMAFGQGSVYHTTVQNRIGQLVQGASITVCTTEPTGAACAGSSKATTYTDLTLGTPCTNVTTASGPTSGTGCTNPGLSDSLGNVSIYGLSSTTPEWMQISGYQITSQQIPFVLCSTGSVTSVGMTGDGTVFNSAVTGSPVTTTGTFAPSLHTQSANRFFAGPTSGGATTPTFRALVTGDLPAGTGTVTSAGFTGDGVVYNASVTGSPITTSGSFAPTLHTQAANKIFAGPTTGADAAPTFRTLVSADVSGLYSGTSPINVSGTTISCPTCLSSSSTSLQVLFANAGYTCSGDQTVCGFTLTWPNAWADTNYDAVCNPGNPTNTSGSASLNNGGQGNKTATTIDVYMTVNGSSSQTYANWTCIGIHR